MTKLKLTPAQKAILAVLDDGLPHPRKELHEAIMRATGDDMSLISVVTHQIHRMRKQLEERGRLINCVLSGRKIMYQQVRRLRSPNQD